MVSSCIFCFLAIANRALNARNDGRYRLEIVLDYHALKWDSNMCVCAYISKRLQLFLHKKLIILSHAQSIKLCCSILLLWLHWLVCHLLANRLELGKSYKCFSKLTIFRGEYFNSQNSHKWRWNAGIWKLYIKDNALAVSMFYHSAIYFHFSPAT